MLRKNLAGYFFRHFQRELQGGRRRREQFLPILRGRKLIEREISTNNRKCFGEFTQALGLKSFLGESAAREIPVPAVNLVEPAFVFPGTGADENVFSRKRAKRSRQGRTIRPGVEQRERQPAHQA